MAAEVDENGNWFVFPTIQFDGKKLKQYKTNEEALEAAISSGNFIKMPSQEEAINYTKGGYKIGTPLETFNTLEDKAKVANTFKEAVE